MAGYSVLFHLIFFEKGLIMKKRIAIICMAIAVLSVSLTVGGVKNGGYNDGNVTFAGLSTYAASEGDESETTEPTQTTTDKSLSDVISEGNSSIDDLIGDKVDSASNAAGIMGGLADFGSGLFGGMDMGGLFEGGGDLFGGLFGGSSGTTTNLDSGNVVTVADTTEEPINTVAPVYAATQQHQQVVIVTQSGASASNENTLETVDYSATMVPYQKPTAELKGGDTGEGVKWMQWIFIYSQYGLDDEGITGVYDKDTIAVVKKLQKEKGMTVDGIVTPEVVEAIEQLYLDALGTVTVATTLPQTLYVPQTPVVEETTQSPVAAIILVFVVILWVLVFAFLIIMIILKKKAKKKAKASENKEPEAKEPEAKEPEAENTVVEEVSLNEISSLADKKSDETES